MPINLRQRLLADVAGLERQEPAGENVSLMADEDEAFAVVEAFGSAADAIGCEAAEHGFETVAGTCAFQFGAALQDVRR
jgi:hypothetical protein